MPDPMMDPKTELDMADLAMTRAKCPVSEVTCYHCGGKGHYKANCPSLEVPLTTMANEEEGEGVW